MKVPKAKKMSSGNYFIRLRLDGQDITVTRPTEKEAIHAAQLIKSEHLNGKKLDACGAKPTLSKAIDEYIAMRSNVLSPATIRGYRIIQRNRFQSVMDSRIDHIYSWQSVINNEARLCSAKTLKNAFLFIRSVLKEYGVDTGKVQLPQVMITPREFLDPDQISVFLNAVKGKDCEMAALLALHSLRRSELLALEKSSVNLSAGTITVRGAVVPDEHNNYIKKETNKNASSARVIPIMIARLADIVAEAPDGQLVTSYANNVGRSINNVCRAANLPEVGVHGLRHSFASLAYHLGLSEKETMEIGGWADQTTMHKIYTHVSHKDRMSAAQKMMNFYNLEK